jgi:hypothetical protein
MMRRLMLCIPLLLLGCGGSTRVVMLDADPASAPTARDPATPPIQPPPPVDAPGGAGETTEADWPALILAIAAEYTGYERVSDRADWAPFLCRPPEPAVLASAAPEQSPHGDKLYYLYAKNGEEYIRLPWQKEGTRAAAGQAVVKQSFHPVKVSAAEARRSGRDTAVRRGIHYTTGEQGELFIMAKVASGVPAPAATDEGWIYGVTDPHGQRILASGRIASCMGCHEKAPHDRLFGLKDPWRER